MATSRLIGDYPVIGIRPTIDGRRGPLKVRESLEVQTMNMAEAAANLIKNNVFYSNGEPVKVVIADTTIGRVAEAAACADKFKKEGVDITLTVTPCWCYGSETMDMDPMTIKAVWGFNGTERPGAVYLAAVLAGHAQKGLPAFGIYGMTFKIWTIHQFLTTYPKRYFVLLVAPLLLPLCAVNHICKSAQFVWV